MSNQDPATDASGASASSLRFPPFRLVVSPEQPYDAILDVLSLLAQGDDPKDTDEYPRSAGGAGTIALTLMWGGTPEWCLRQFSHLQHTPDHAVIWFCPADVFQRPGIHGELLKLPPDIDWSLIPPAFSESFAQGDDEARLRYIKASIFRSLRTKQHLRSLDQALAQTRNTLEDRKWVDRAKGMLMQARGLDEPAAFAMLRSAAMHTNLKIADVSRSVVAAAGQAEALNRAGQLRMLSQRLMKLAAQRCTQIDARKSRAQHEQALSRTQENLQRLDHLLQGEAALAVTRPVLNDVQTAFRRLEKTLQRPSARLDLLQADQDAELMLQHAEALVEGLEQAANRRTLHIINVCGRQRMRIQRIAKNALIASLFENPAVPTDDSPQASLMRDFEQALVELEVAPLSTPDIRSSLANARVGWSLVANALHHMGKPESIMQVSKTSDSLLETFDQLTNAFEHSIQVIMS